MTFKKLSAEYDRLYEEAGGLFKKYDPCKFVDGVCSNNKHWAKEQNIFSKNGCCGYCRHVGPNGCKVKALGCKLFMCVYLETKNKECFKEIGRLRARALKAIGSGALYCYTTKKLFMGWERKKRAKRRIYEEVVK